MERKVGFLVGSTNILIPTTPALKPDAVVNLDENKFDFRATDKMKLARTHTMSDKKFINGLTKAVRGMDHGVLKKEE